MGVSMSTVLTLREQGHEAVHLREENLGHLPDGAIIIVEDARYRLRRLPVEPSREE